MDKILMINKSVFEFFAKHSNIHIIPPKDLMPYFIKAGIFPKDEKAGLPIRKILRQLDKEHNLSKIPFVMAERKAVNTNWFFQRTQTNASVLMERETNFPENIQKNPTQKNRDEDYVLDLCDEVLALKGLRQHRFDFLTGDAGTRLPVDIYYPTLNLVVEYREYQHSNAVAHFDKPDKLTVSGVHRGEQRKIYDQRRREVIPKYGIKPIELDFTDFVYSANNRIIRTTEMDLELVKLKLKGVY